MRIAIGAAVSEECTEQHGQNRRPKTPGGIACPGVSYTEPVLDERTEKDEGGNLRPEHILRTFRHAIRRPRCLENPDVIILERRPLHAAVENSAGPHLRTDEIRYVYIEPCGHMEQKNQYSVIEISHCREMLLTPFDSRRRVSAQRPGVRCLIRPRLSARNVPSPSRDEVHFYATVWIFSSCSKIFCMVKVQATSIDRDPLPREQTNVKSLDEDVVT